MIKTAAFNPITSTGKPTPPVSWKLCALLGTLALTAGCDSSDDSQVLSDPNQLEVTLIAPLLAPDTSATLSASFMQTRPQRSEECPDVPDGYAPLPNIGVQFLDASGNTISESASVTDDCGKITAPIPTGATSISASSAGFEDLVAGLESIVASGGVASTIPEGAEYRIGFLTSVDNTSLGFTVIDSVSNKAVVGLPIGAFSVDLDDQSFPLVSLTNRTTSDNASIVMVLDASPSMDDIAFTDTESGTEFSRLNLSAIAAHEFLDQKDEEDEVAMVIFDRKTDFIDQSRFDELFDLLDTNEEPTDYQFPVNGFTQESSALRILVDAYNKDSKLWGANKPFDKHPESPAVTIAGNYPWRSFTAYYDGTILASERLNTRSNPRRVIITLSDGGNNSGSVRRLSTVIEKANANSTPVYTIGFEFSEEDELKKLAVDTGATYFKANSLQLSDAYTSIQSGIIFQYTGKLADSYESAGVVTLILDLDGDGIADTSRVLVN